MKGKASASGIRWAAGRSAERTAPGQLEAEKSREVNTAPSRTTVILSGK